MKPTMRSECCNRRDGITCVDCPEDIRQSDPMRKPRSLAYDLSGLLVECRACGRTDKVGSDDTFTVCKACGEWIHWPISWQAFSDSGCNRPQLVAAMSEAHW